MPLDPAYPRERLALMLADLGPAADADENGSGAPVLLTEERLLTLLPEHTLLSDASGRVICLDRPAERAGATAAPSPAAAPDPAAEGTTWPT